MEILHLGYQYISNLDREKDNFNFNSDPQPWWTVDTEERLGTSTLITFTVIILERCREREGDY